MRVGVGGVVGGVEDEVVGGFEDVLHPAGGGRGDGDVVGGVDGGVAAFDEDVGRAEGLEGCCEADEVVG